MCKVSVIMPVYNVQDFVGRAIACVLEQTFTDYELILVDDGSTDNSPWICEAIAAHDPRIRTIRQDNRVLAAARNTGIRSAIGDYIAFLDSDDLWAPDKLAQHVALLDSDDRIGVSYSASEFIDMSGRSTGLYQTPKCDDVSTADILLRNPIGNGSVAVIRREVFEQIRFVDETGRNAYFNPELRQSEDIECWVRIAATTDWQFKGISDALTLYRVNDNGLSANVEKQFFSWLQAIALMREYAPELIRQFGRQAKAYQYRYLARRAIFCRDRKTAVALFFKAILSSPKIAIVEPGRTLNTLSAALALICLPQVWWDGLYQRAVRWNARFNNHPIYQKGLPEPTPG